MNVRDCVMNLVDKMKFDKLHYYLNSNIYPTNLWYREHLERNFEVVSLGGDIAQWDFQLNSAKEKRMNWGLRNQTLIQDFVVLKNFFSILKPTGIVIFPFFSEGELLSGWRKVKDVRPYLFDMQAYYFTLRHWRIVLMKISKHFPLLLVRPKDLYYWLRTLLYDDVAVNDMIRNYRKQSHYQIQEDDVVKVKKLVMDICTFCGERELIPVFVKMPTINESETSEILENVFVDKIFLDLSVDKEMTHKRLFEDDGLRMNDLGRELLKKRIMDFFLV